MEHLLYKFDSFKAEIIETSLFLAIDYDALAPEAASPERAILPIQTRRILQELSNKGNSKIAVLSGRGALDLRQMVKLKNVFYIGNHGLEIRNELKLFALEQKREVKIALWEALRTLTDVFSSFEDIAVIDKKYTLSVHLRNINVNQEKKIRVKIRKILKKYTDEKLLRISYSQKTIHILPSCTWNKNSAIDYIKSELLQSSEKRLLNIFIAGDSSEENWLDSFNYQGVTVQVGKARSDAKYYLEDIYEVQKFLAALLEETSPKKETQEYFSKYSRRLQKG